MSDHTFQDCVATQMGGVLHVDHTTAGAQATLTSCTMLSPRSDTYGGAVSILKGVAAVQDCAVMTAQGGLGGSFCVLGGQLFLLRVKVYGSEAGIGGGGVCP